MADMLSGSEPVMIMLTDEEALNNIQEMTIAYGEWEREQDIKPGPEVYKAFAYAAQRFVPEVSWVHFMAQVYYDGKQLCRRSMQ